MRIFKAATLFVGGFLAEWLWATYLPVFGLSPRVVLVLTVAASSWSGPVAGQCYGFFWGLFLDLLSPHTFGAGALALTLAGYGVGDLRRQMDVTSPLSQFMITGLVSLAYCLFLALAGLVFERRFLWCGWHYFLLGSLYNALVAPAAFAIARRCLEP
jgi:rod shape-determining protein MreD